MSHERVGVESMEGWLRRQPLRWYGHLLRRGENTKVGRVLTVEAAGTQGSGRPVRGWKDVIENDMRMMGLEKGMASVGDNRKPVKSKLWVILFIWGMPVLDYLLLYPIYSKNVFTPFGIFY